MTYFPGAGDDWRRTDPADAGLDPARLAEAVRFAEAHETAWPRDIEKDGRIPSLTDLEKPPFNEILGPLKPRGGPSGLIIRGGAIAAEWGDPGRADMTFSIAKSYLSILAGVAVADGLIDDVDRPLADTMPAELFAGAHNARITWRHLLHQTSEWEGTLFDKPDLVDRNRQVGPGSDNSRKGEHRDLQPPGSYWEYNDVRVNLLSLSLLHTFRKPLPEVLAERIMGPIGASDTWTWFGYRNSFVEIDGVEMQSVPGGTHWGGGIHINSYDHARFGLLVHREGVWDGRAILPAGWIRDLRTPCPIRPGYGYLWWLNTGHGEWPGASESSYSAVGAGTNIIWIDPDNDLVVVARWMDQASVAEFLGLVSAAAG
ncbi:MAG: serine hydrolase [Magnetovibrio sp.]|nr:serine hydrolase [Magnetovibrio sp.]